MGSSLSTTFSISARGDTSIATAQTQQNKQHDNNSTDLSEYITTQNNLNSHLHRLPTELLQEIDNYLQPDPSLTIYGIAFSRMALRATCRRLRTELSGPPGPEYRWPIMARKGYPEWLSLGQFYTLCDMESRDELGGHEYDGSTRQLVCRACRTTHSEECFTPVEQTEEPGLRRCIGSNGVLRLCPHKYATYDDLHMRCTNMTCTEVHYPDSGLGGSPVTLRPEVEEEGKKEAKIEVEFALGVADDKVQSYIIAAMMQKAGWALCPHLQSRSEEAWLAVLQSVLKIPPDARSGNMLGTLSRWIIRSRDEPEWHPGTFGCATPGCDTRITVSTEQRKGNDMPKCVFLKIERFLGSLSGGADDRKWLAQITPRKGIPNVESAEPSSAVVQRLDKKATRTRFASGRARFGRRAET